MSILLLAGSPSTPSRSGRLLRYVGSRLSSLGHICTDLNVRDLHPQALLHADFNHPEIVLAKDLVAQARAVVVATPVYKAAYSGALKAFLDLLPQDGLSGKLVLPLATGGSQSHMLALDYALRPVLSSLSARHILPSIYATDAQVVWSEQNGLVLDNDIVRRVEHGAEQLSASLRALASHAAPFKPVPFADVRCSV